MYPAIYGQSRAYSSVWDKDAKFKTKNVTDVVKDELNSGTFEHLVLGAPTVDISNLKTDEMAPNDDTEHLKQKVIASCENIFKVAQHALQGTSGVKHVTIMDHAPRFDIEPLKLKSKFASFANNYFLQLWLDCVHKDKITVGSHTLDCPPDIRQLR